jgi:hypothetical protein
MEPKASIRTKINRVIKNFGSAPRAVQIFVFMGIFAILGGLYLWRAPAATVYNIPTTIAADCSRDVTAELNSWIRSVPNGTSSLPNVLMFGAEKCYRVDGKLIQQNTYVVGDRYYQNITLDGNGSKLDGSKYVLPTTKINHDMIAFIDPVNLTIQNFTLVGQHTNPCNLDAAGNCRDGGAVASYEWYTGIAIGGGQNVTLRNNKIFNMYGDGIMLHGGHVAGNRDANGVLLWANAPPKNVLIENNIIDGTGRHGIGLVAGDGVIVKANTFDRNSYHVVDMEYEGAQPIRNITFDGNTIKRHYLAFIAATTGGEQGECPPEGFNNNHVFINNIMTVSGVTTTMPIWESTTQDACAPDKKDIRIENNTLIHNHGSDVNGVIKLHRVIGTIKISGNRIIQADPSRTYSAVTISNSPATISIRNNDGRESAYAYMLDGIRNKSGVDACGNTTALGTNIPIACATTPTTDNINPTVSVTSPPSGSVVIGTVNVSANAADNIGVTRVDFLVDGVVRHTDTTAPYNYAWDTVSVAPGTSHTLSVKAYDAANNSATATVTVSVANSSPTASKTFNGTLGNFGSTVHAVNIPKAGNVSLNLSWVQGSSFVMEVFDTNDNIVTTKSGESSPLTASFNAPVAGDYSIRIKVNKKPSRKYTLTVTYPL